ncbi:BamA/TamA family outer membrane protein [Adhaeribacter aquaticus]|uniref:BamA/TamA family outer membrane protein n=1 Tax=Adhaeribacter aquaticus TaxID=299567 RepID=UPI0012F7C960|nr:BamA/TamA family outer membrane protein [Adhaeribacter aquaticus]
MEPVITSDGVTARQKDLLDVVKKIKKKNREDSVVSPHQGKSNLHISVLPMAGYSLQTGFAILGVANAAFYTDTTVKTNVSSVLTNITYSQYNQILFPFQTTIWTKGNRYKIITDWRFLKFPSITYGLGGNTIPSNGYNINYFHLRFYQTVLKSIGSNIYAGLGFNLDFLWNVQELGLSANEITDFQLYGYSKKSTAAGPTFNLSFDNRENSINPNQGYFMQGTYRPNLKLMGSSSNWQSLIVDSRKYVKFPTHSENVLAFWNYNWLTLNGDPPYLLLPSTGTDINNNSGRGYIQGRFRSKNMLYLETEYRFKITRNGLLGAVTFINAQSFTEQNNQFSKVIPGYGAGIRLKVNKYSRTNVGIDYGVGIGGSRGFFVNLGEVF